MLFLHKYALAIGWPVPLLKKIMSARDIAEAMAYHKINPYGEERADFRNGILASLIANVNRKSGSKPFKPADFMPEFGKKKASKAQEIKNQILEAFSFGNSS